MCVCCIEGLCVACFILLCADNVLGEMMETQLSDLVKRENKSSSGFVRTTFVTEVKHKFSEFQKLVPIMPGKKQIKLG